MVSVALLAVRLIAASRIGFGDSEALYASYALFPQPMYLDHPGAIGLLARLLGQGSAPTPEHVHMFTAVFATLVPWLLFRVARNAGATLRASTITATVFALVPEISIGLFGFTPDLLLAFGWLGSLAFAAQATSAKDEKAKDTALILTGLCAGLAAASKVSGVLLFLAVALWLVKAHRKNRYGYVGLLIGALPLLVLGYHEATTGAPMLHHRLSATQAGAGFSLMLLGKVLGGQLGYVSPVVLFLVVVYARDLWKTRAADAFSQLLFLAFLVPLVPLLVFSLWSPRAEPHWLAPPLLAIGVHAARRGLLGSRRIVTAAAITAGALTAAVHAWVLVPESARLVPKNADPRANLAAELYGWNNVVDAVRSQLAAEVGDAKQEIVVVGPHWTVCAQLQAALENEAKIGCLTDIPDDFDHWNPRPQWQRARKVLFVTDARFPQKPEVLFPTRAVESRSGVSVFRGGVRIRVFSLTLLTRTGSG